MLSISRGCLAVTTFAVLALPGMVCAQQPVAARRCSRPDTTAHWYTTQRDWWARDAKHDWTNDTLRTQMLAAAAHLEPVPLLHAPFPLQLGVMVAPPIAAHPTGPDSAQIERMREVLRSTIAGRAMPLRSAIGVAGEHAAWLIVGSDSALMVAYTHQLMEAGGDESSPFDVAVVEDWIRLTHGRKPIYASQFQVVRGANGREELQPLPTEDMAHVDIRRENAALPPLAFALCVARSRTGVTH